MGVGSSGAPRPRRRARGRGGLGGGGSEAALESLHERGHVGVLVGHVLDVAVEDPHGACVGLGGWVLGGGGGRVELGKMTKTNACMHLPQRERTVREQVDLRALPVVLILAGEGLAPVLLQHVGDAAEREKECVGGHINYII